MSKGRRIGAKRSAGSSFSSAAAQVDQLSPATRATNSLFNAASISRNRETLFEQKLSEERYRRHRASLPLDRRMVEHRAPSHAASSTELCS